MIWILWPSHPHLDQTCWITFSSERCSTSQCLYTCICSEIMISKPTRPLRPCSNVSSFVKTFLTFPLVAPSNIFQDSKLITPPSALTQTLVFYLHACFLSYVLFLKGRDHIYSQQTKKCSSHDIVNLKRLCILQWEMLQRGLDRQSLDTAVSLLSASGQG